MRLNDYAHAYVGIGTDEEIRVKITSTLKEFKPEKNNFNYEKMIRLTLNLSVLKIHQSIHQSG